MQQYIIELKNKLNGGAIIMISYYETIEKKICVCSSPKEGCWINVINPTNNEINFLINELGIYRSFIESSLDEEEFSHIIKETDQLLIVIDAPIPASNNNNSVLYTTIPIGIIVKDEYIVTICLRENPILHDLSVGLSRNLNTSLKTQFLFNILLRVATKYLYYLKQIEKLSNIMELKLHKSMRNKELFHLLGLEKSLVYFSTSLKANEVTLEKILRGRAIKLYEEDHDLLEDVLIEVRQAIEMSNIYSSILSGTMDAFASIISNNLNIVMKVLTSITILMTIPTMIYSFYGMNVEGLPVPEMWFPLALSIFITIIIFVILIKTKMFK